MSSQQTEEDYEDSETYKGGLTAAKHSATRQETMIFELHPSVLEATW